MRNSFYDEQLKLKNCLYTKIYPYEILTYGNFKDGIFSNYGKYIAILCVKSGPQEVPNFAEEPLPHLFIRLQACEGTEFLSYKER